MNEKMTGYILLCAGLVIMFGSLIQVLMVFTNKTEPIAVFHLDSPKLSLSSFLPSLPQGVVMPQTASQSIELIPTAAFNKVLNMSTNLFLMGFVLSFGSKVASLGVMLLRPVSVKLNNKTDTAS